ncbi:MAG TPA: type IV pilus assembly protein PilM [Tepidisphaeraceae bacterium]|jgi:type IV pilus assembly protein PilM
MIRFTRAQVQPIGIDIGHDSIKMLQVEVSERSLSVVAAAKRSFSEEVRSQPQLRLAMAVEMIRQMLREEPFSGRHAVTSLPRDVVHVKNLRLPAMPVGELEAAVQFEARNLFPFDTEQARVQFMAAGEVRQGADVKQEVIVLAARNDDINDFLEHMHRCGVVVDSLDVEPCGLFRSVERFIRRREDESEVHVLVDIGACRSQVLIGKGKEITFFKPIDIGGQHLHEAVSKKLGISLSEAQALRVRLSDAPEVAGGGKRDPVRQAVFDAVRSTMEELGREISLCLRYYSVTFRGQRPTRLRLVGGEAADAQLQSLLNAALTIPVETGRPLYSVDTQRMKSSDRKGMMSEWALALGLGLRFTEGRFGPRDGKPRDPNAPREDIAPTTAEVIDLNQVVRAAAGEEQTLAAIGAGGGTGAAARAPRPSTKHVPPEAMHA